MKFFYCGKPKGIVGNRVSKSREDCEENILKQFELLERVTLPSLRDQSDPQFRLVLLTSTRMPQECKDHLTWLLNHYLPGRSEVLFARPMVAGRVFRNYMQRLGDGPDTVIQTQVLEGDAFGVTFVKTLREHAIQSWSQIPTEKGQRTGGTFMSFKRGLKLRLRENTPVGLEVTSTSNAPFGLSLVARRTGRYNPELINPDVLGVKLPHVSIRTRDIHCMRVVSGESARNMPPVDEDILIQARQEFGVLKSADAVARKRNRLRVAQTVDGVIGMRRAG
ncbi:glycosyltransferase [uncultured Litoreibacter sp.]|uniref:glycosyltransferase n=1 Tax=uncultured Litoreibacter sp. TaxID=1392394 RepID=UPI0026281321|nr:glycosyltransferase [uncultured Litoreibacter sp.]